MTTSIEATVLLADAAQATGGKLFVLGGGWTRLKPNSPTTMALAVVVHMPYDQTNRTIHFSLSLKDDDGQPVSLEGGPIAGKGQFEAGRPPGIKPGERSNFPLALTFHGIALGPNGYVWEFEVEGDVVARCPFRVVE